MGNSLNSRTLRATIVAWLVGLAACGDPEAVAPGEELGARAAALVCGQLRPGESLSRGQSLRSCNNAVELRHQLDGNVVAYDAQGALWFTGTNGRPTTHLIMQSDGNLVLYNGSTPVWHTSTNGNNGAYLGIQGDCNLVIYHGGRPIWATYRVCRAANPGRIDTLAYMINTSGKAVQDTRSGYGQMQRTDYVASEKRLRYMKNPYDAQRWELYFHDDSRVWLYQDTTQPAGEGASGTTSYQIEPASGMWMSRNWAVGDVTSFRATIKHYNHLERPCNFKGVDGLWKDGRHKLRFAGAVNLGGNLGQRDVIIVDRYHDLVVDPYNPKAAERFWYAKDLGWVRWDHWHDRTVPGSNWDSNDINVIVSPGVFWNPARPNENTNLRRVDMNTLNNTNPGTAPSHCR